MICNTFRRNFMKVVAEIVLLNELKYLTRIERTFYIKFFITILSHLSICADHKPVIHYHVESRKIFFMTNLEKKLLPRYTNSEINIPRPPSRLIL